MIKRLIPVLFCVLFVAFPAYSQECKVTIAGPDGGSSRPCTSDEIKQRAIDAAQVPQVPLVDQLKAIFMSLPTETQAAFGPTAAAVFMFLEQGNPAAAKAVIQQAQIPPELETLRTQMMKKFP